MDVLCNITEEQQCSHWDAPRHPECPECLLFSSRARHLHRRVLLIKRMTGCSDSYVNMAYGPSRYFSRLSDDL